MKVLNLYACLGGNRLLWDNCEVTAVELDPELARMYKDRFPNDEVIVADAHQYLLDHYKEFDFIWSSPPCPTHSRARFWSSKGGRYNVQFPDLKLYEEIIFLDNFFDGKWIVENVIPYYEPLLQPSQEIDRHLYWSNFTIPKTKARKASVCQGTGEFKRLEQFHKIKLDSTYNGEQRALKVLRNMVDYEVGDYIFNLAKGIYNSNNITQKTIFDL
jgi:DNA (cytosine-5)-methyltransferase 1